MARGTSDGGLGTDLVLPAGLGPITPGLLVGIQEAVTGEALPLRAPGPPQVRLMLLRSNAEMRLYRRAKNTQNGSQLTHTMRFCEGSDVDENVGREGK